MTEPEVIGTIDMTPTDDGFVNIALMFAASLRSDVRRDRKADAPAQMFALCDIVRYLAATSAKSPLDADKRARLDRLMTAIKEGVR